jgi:hypothetical protein
MIVDGATGRAARATPIFAHGAERKRAAEGR